MRMAPVEWKQLREVRTVTFDFTTKLIEGDAVATIVGNVLIVDPAGGTAPLVATAPQRVVNVVTSRLSGGTVGARYRVSCLVTTTGGETLELDMILGVAEGAN